MSPILIPFGDENVKFFFFLWCSHFDYITSRRQGTVYVRKSYTVEMYPEELKSKVYLLKHFERYIMDRLYGEYNYTFEDVGREKGMEWVQKYLRMKHVIVFKLSHDVLQVKRPFPRFFHRADFLSSSIFMIILNSYSPLMASL